MWRRRHRQRGLFTAATAGDTGRPVKTGKRQHEEEVQIKFSNKLSSNYMDKKMAYQPSFFEIFKAQCSESDLGPISLNWFEELSSEAPPYEPKLLGELDGHTEWFDEASFKTPRAKPSTYSQLASTPLIFKEPSTILPPSPLSSPGKELDQKTTKENLISPRIITKLDQGSEIFASPVGTCHAASPAILRNTYRTPQRSGIPGPYGSLFCTPKLLEIRTPNRISESLGAEVDPDMSWSSSLATPPTLGATVIIARENDSISEVKQQDDRAEVVSHIFFSKPDKCPGRSDISVQSVLEAIKLDYEDLESEKTLGGSFGDVESFEDAPGKPARSSGSFLLMPNAPDAAERREITTDDKAYGEGSVSSEQHFKRQTGSSQEMVTTSWTEEKYSEMKDSLFRNMDEDRRYVKHAYLIGHEKELESFKMTTDVHDNRIQKSPENKKLVKEDLSSSPSQWSQLNLSDLDVTHLEMSMCSSPPSDLSREKKLEEKSVLMTKKETVETSLSNTSSLLKAQDLLKAQELLSVNLSEKHYEVKNSENNPALEMPPIKSVSMSIQDSKLIKGFAAEKVSKVSFIDCNSILIESTNVTEYAVVYNSSFSRHLKATSKSVITDVLSHPLVCSPTAPDNCSDLHLTDSENTFTKSDFKRLNMLSSLKKRSKRFIYTINNTLLYKEEKIQRELTSESPVNTLPSSEFDSCEFTSCQVARGDDQGCLVSSERKHLQSNIRENNFSTCTMKMDIMDNSSTNTFNNGQKQQDLKDTEENAREHQSVTSLQCLEISNTLKEDMADSSNSESISNIKRKVVTSARLMARKHSRLLPKGHCLEKGKEDMLRSIKVSDGDDVPQSVEGQLAESSLGNNECLVDVKHKTTPVTNGSFNNTSRQINSDIGSNCNKISTEIKPATEQLSAAEHREILAPLGLKDYPKYNTELKQREKIDVASSSEIVGASEDIRSMENEESNLQATTCDNTDVESTKEFLDCTVDNSLNGVIPENNKQTDLFEQDVSQKVRLNLSKKVPEPNTEAKHYLKKTNVIPSKIIASCKDIYSVKPVYFNKNANENLEHKERWLRNLNECNLNLSFSGFQTASNKQIKFSEESLAKGKILFREIENECFEASSMARVRNTSDQVKEENTFFSPVESKLDSNLPDSLGSQASFLEPRHIQFVPHKVDLHTNFPVSQQSLQETSQALTASQEAEIAELSSILEETGSQFEFTQFRKQSNMLQSHVTQQCRTGEKNEKANVENTSTGWKDTDFCNALKSENQVKKSKYCNKQEDSNEESATMECEKENKIVFHKNNDITFTHLGGNGSSMSGQSFPMPIQDSFSNFMGFTSAGGKRINISKAALARSAELFRDMDDDNYLFKPSEANTRCQNSNRHKSPDCKFLRCQNQTSGKTVCVTNFKSPDSCTGCVSHNSEKKYEENIRKMPFRGNTEKWTKRSRNDEIVNFGCTDSATHSASELGTTLSATENHNQHLKTSKQLLTQGDCPVEGILQEDSSAVMCLGGATATGEKHSLSVSDEIEKSIPGQKGQERNPEDKYLPQSLQTAADRDICSISAASLSDSVSLLKAKCERDAVVSETSDKQKTSIRNMEEADTAPGKNLFVNHGKAKIGSYHDHQIPFQQERDAEENVVKGIYPAAFRTASGKKITISDEFLAKAKQFFSEENVILGKTQNDNFEQSSKKRMCSTDCVKDWDSCIESTAKCDPEILDFNKNFLHKETGDQFKHTIEHSPFKQTVILDTVQKDTFVNIDKDYEKNAGIRHAQKEANVRLGKLQLEYLPGKDSNALRENSLSKDEKLFDDRDEEYMAKNGDHSENTHGCPMQSAASVHLMKASNDLAGDSVPRDAKNGMFVENSENKSKPSLLFTYNNSVSESSSSYLNCSSRESDLEHLNESCLDANCFTDATVPAHQEQSLAGGLEDETDLTRLEQTSHSFNLEKQMGGLKPIIIHTAKGKAVSVSENALARVRQIFQEDESVKSKPGAKSKINQMEVAANSSFIVHAECPDSAKLLNVTKNKETNSFASHLTKVNENTGENGHHDRKILADAESVPDSQMQFSEQNVKLLAHLPMRDKQIKTSVSSVSNLGFFSTASGKPVQLSEESLRKARQLFSEMDNNSSSHLQEILPVEEDVNKSEVSMEAVPKKTGLVPPKGRESSSTDLVLHPAFGFSTASGKQVKVSESAYQKAKAILKDSDDFVSNRLCITNQLGSTKENTQPIKSVTDCNDAAKIVDKVILEPKVKESFSEELELENIYSEEMKPLASTHCVKMPEYVPHSKKNEQLMLLKNSFQQEGTSPLGEGQQNLEKESKSEAVSRSCATKAELNINRAYFQPPKIHLEVEAVESAKAFMEDDLSDSGARVNASQSFSSRMLDKSFPNRILGKRHLEGYTSLGEPPVKRKLLPEFDRTKNPTKSLKASKSTPDGIFKDRRKFIYNVPLKPVTCGPFDATKERQEVKTPTFTLPDQDFKGFKSKSAIFQHCALRQSFSGTSGTSTPCKASAKETEEPKSLHKPGKTVKTFTPPFRTKLTFSTDEQDHLSRCDSLVSKNRTKEREINQNTVEQNTAEAHHPQSEGSSNIPQAADTGLENDNSVMNKMVTNLHCARDLQEMRIKKKYRQNISVQPGSLYVIKTSARNRISLKTAVEEKSPGSYSAEELYKYGVSKSCIEVNSVNAESFQFIMEEFFSKEYLLAGHGIQLADGGWLIPADDGKAGKREFYRALCDTPGVDPKLITEAWVYNHYRWIVWKLAAMEVSFPHEFANRCLTPETVLLQLKYRYDLEVDKSKRSAIKKIMEKDDTAGKTLVLCVSKIISQDTIVSPSSSNKSMENKKEGAIIEVTDGWYGIRALLDPPLKAFMLRRRLTVGQKVIVHGAELVGSQDGCAPLEAPDSLMLKISANSTRCARWNAKLGFHRDPRPFPLPLASLYSEGGPVGCVDVVIQRTYPIQWMEKTSCGSYVFRDSQAEEREAAKHAEEQQKKLEALFAKIQEEYEKHEERSSRRALRSRVVTRQQIHNLQDGAELYEAIQNASDPGSMEAYLSEGQLKALSAHRQVLNDKKQAQIQAEFKKAVESAEQEERGYSKRDVSAVWRLCVVDYRKQEKHHGVMLSIWRPLPDVCSLLKEGSRYRIYQLLASQSKGRSNPAKIQLTATKKTQYLQLPVSQRMLSQIFSPRKALTFTSLSDPSFQPACAEVDLVGVVVSMGRTGFTTLVYLSDESYNLVAVKLRAELGQPAVGDVVARGSLVCASNLQWQPAPRAGLPVLSAGELSVFSASPKESHLQQKFNQLRSSIEDVDSFCSDAERKLMNLLQRNGPFTPSLPKRYGLECPSPCNTGFPAGPASLISSPNIEVKYQSPLVNSVQNAKLVAQGSVQVSSPALANEEHPKSSRKRRALDLLSRVPPPPPLTPLCSILSPALKKAFQPPRRLGFQHSKSPKATKGNIGDATPGGRLAETVHLAENDLVADEELAMINTQALLSALPEEKKTECENENGSTVATDLSDVLLQKNSSRSAGEASNSSRNYEGAVAFQKDTEEAEGLLPD